MAGSSENRGTDKDRLHVIFRDRNRWSQRIETGETSPHALETVPQTTMDEAFLPVLCLFERR